MFKRRDDDRELSDHVDEATKTSAAPSTQHPTRSPTRFLTHQFQSVKIVMMLSFSF